MIPAKLDSNKMIKPKGRIDKAADVLYAYNMFKGDDAQMPAKWKRFTDDYKRSLTEIEKEKKSGIKRINAADNPEKWGYNGNGMHGWIN